MLIDITLQITPKIVRDAQGNESKTLTGIWVLILM